MIARIRRPAGRRNHPIILSVMREGEMAGHNHLVQPFRLIVNCVSCIRRLVIVLDMAVHSALAAAKPHHMAKLTQRDEWSTTKATACIIVHVFTSIGGFAASVIRRFQTSQITA